MADAAPISEIRAALDPQFNGIIVEGMAWGKYAEQYLLTYTTRAYNVDRYIHLDFFPSYMYVIAHAHPFVWHAY